MEFRLTYEGDLPSSGNTAHADAKHHIRKEFHPQLKKLWENTPPLSEMRWPSRFPDITRTGGGGEAIMSFGVMSDMSRVEWLAGEMPRLGDYQFVPLVTEDLNLWCGLEILFLRHGRPGEIFNAGDIDGRLKTLIDGLKMPQQLSDLGTYADRPDNDEIPFYCLLRDDSLVSRVAVETDVLLEELKGGIPSKNDARVVVSVKLRPQVFHWGNMGFV
jgi:hypothetical protein